MKAYELTDYPRIYIHTYWGAFPVDGNFNREISNDEIIENRNRFIREFNIYKSADHPKYIQKILDDCNADKVYTDHVELYINDNKEYVILSSPYDMSEATQQKYAEKGWALIYKLYSTTANTFMKTVPMRRRRPSFNESS
jgi:hypothetical protein